MITMYVQNLDPDLNAEMLRFSYPQSTNMEGLHDDVLIGGLSNDEVPATKATLSISGPAI